MINRPLYLKKLINFKDKEPIKVITGIRRCGKSKLVDLYIDYLKSEGVSSENILKYNFESLAFQSMTYQELYQDVMNKCRDAVGRVYLFFDEVQKIDRWELAINSFRVDLNADIYVTGSNAYLLSSQLSTYLSGRFVEIKVYPLSFKEFIDFNTFKENVTLQEKFSLYLKYGGMPMLAEYDFNQDAIDQVLDGIISTVLVKDVVAQAEVRDTALLNKIIRFLADNIGNLTSTNNIKNILLSQNRVDKKTTVGTVDNYIALLENAYVFFGVDQYDIKGKNYLKAQGKYYIADIGLRNHLLGFREMDRGHILENIVFLEYLRRGYHVSIGKIGTNEVDFVVTKSDEKIYVQVTETLSGEDVRQRELKPLRAIRDNYRKVIFSMDETFSYENIDGIELINIPKWLLGYDPMKR